MRAGAAIPWTRDQRVLFASKDRWKAGQTLPRFVRLTRKMAILALGAIHKRVRTVIQRLFHSLLVARVEELSGIFSQMISFGLGASLTVAPRGFFFRQA